MNYQFLPPKNHIHLWAIAASGALPFVPDIADAGVYPFAILFCIASILALYKTKKNASIDLTSGCIILFLIYLLFNSIIAASHNTSLSDWLRGIAPFLFLLGYPIAIKLHKSNLKSIYQAIWLASTLWLLRLTILAASSFNELVSGNVSRLSHISTETLIPFGMIGFILTLHHFSLNRIEKIIFSIAFLTAIVLAGYRSQIAICALAVFIWGKFYRPNRFIIFSPLIAAGIYYLLQLDISIIDAIISRFQNISQEKGGVRDNELQFALANFYDSPLYGKGLSFPIPVELTRDDTMADLLDKQSVRYIHNVVGYFLMNTGIIGTLIFLIIWGSGTKEIYKWRKHYGKNNIFSGTSTAWIALSVFFLISASYRQIQTMLIFSAMLFILKKTNLRTEINEIRNSNTSILDNSTPNPTNIST